MNNKAKLELSQANNKAPFIKVEQSEVDKQDAQHHVEAILFDDFEKITFSVVKLEEGNYLGFRISGDSMNGGYINDTPANAIVLGRELEKKHWSDGFRESAHDWVLLTEKGTLFRDIKEFDKENETINCRSRNGNLKYLDVKLSFKSVCQIFEVVKRSF